MDTDFVVEAATSAEKRFCRSGHIRDILDYLAADEMFRDLMLSPGDAVEGSRRVYLPCHSVVLAAASPGIKQLLESIYQENEEPYVILFPDRSQKELEDLITLAYSRAEPKLKSLDKEDYSNYDSEPNMDDIDIRNDLDFLKLEHNTDHEQEDFNDRKPFENEGRVTRRAAGLKKRPSDWEPELNGKLMKRKKKRKVKIRNSRGLSKFRERLPSSSSDDDKSDAKDSTFEPGQKLKRSKINSKNETNGPKKVGRPSKYPYTCDRCQSTITDRRSQYRHVTACINKRNKSDFICHNCGLSLGSQPALKRHLAMKCEDACKICRTVFVTRILLRKHMFEEHQRVLRFRRSVLSSKEFKCPKCDKMYAKKESLQIHISQVHDGTVEKVQCPKCGALLSSKSALTKHMVLHDNSAVACPLCPKKFRNQRYVNRHMLTVHGNREDLNHKCDLCEKAFINKESLEGHMNWHLDLKPYSCRWCGKAYQNRSNLSAHSRKNHPEQYSVSKMKFYSCAKLDPSSDTVRPDHVKLSTTAGSDINSMKKEDNAVGILNNTDLNASAINSEM